MMGAPEIVTLNAALIKALHATKIIDIGVFTGASSLAAALALPPDAGKIIACDISEDFTNEAKRYWKEAGVESKISLRIAPAGDTLNDLIRNGESGTYDFAFIDADKGGYDLYYELCLQLLRPGGIIAFDNTLWSGRVLNPAVNGDDDTKAIQVLNDKLAKDHGRSFVVQLNVGDGYTIAVKL
jgi:predicted O-methyltransferase YrrM